MRYLPILLLLASCATSAVSSNEAGGVVRIRGMLDGQKKGMAFAETECAKYGKIARYGSTNDIRGTMSYECVAK